MTITAIQLAKSVKTWWDSHEFDSYPDGEGGEFNAFDDEPEFVTMAKEIILGFEREQN